MLLLALGIYSGIHANGRKKTGRRKDSNMWKNSIILIIIVLFQSLEEGLYWGDFPFRILTIEIRHILKEDNYHLILHGSLYLSLAYL